MKPQLFEKLCQIDVLQKAWSIVKSKKSAGGIDGVSVKDFEEKSSRYLTEILQELKTAKWTPYPYLAVTIPKKENERRNIGLLSIKDKVIQTAIKILVEPRFERLFVGNSYGYRPGKGHNEAIRKGL